MAPPQASFRDVLSQLYPPRPQFTESDIPSQRGKVFVVTGGSAGIGSELCKILYGTGATIYLTARSQSRAEEAIKSIESSSTAARETGTLKFLLLDLNDLQSVQDAAASFAKQERKLDVLWNNAATGAFLVAEGSRTAQGLEPMVGMHCVAVQYFTELLLPQLRAATAATDAPATDAPTSHTSAARRVPPARVVWSSSIAADGSTPENGIDFDSLDGNPDRLQAYATSKVGNWLLCREFARRHADEGILTVTVNPGNVATGSYEGMPGFLHFVMRLLVLHKPKLAAYTNLYAGLSPELNASHNGGYVLPWGRIRQLGGWSRKDIVMAVTPEAEGGLGYDVKFWDWCYEQWTSKVSLAK